MAWAILFLAGLCEVAWAVGLKYTEGFTQFKASSLTVLALLTSIWLLGLSVQSLPLSVAYGAWVGIGTVGSVLLGFFLFDEPLSVMKLLSVIFIVLGVIGLKLASP